MTRWLQAAKRASAVGTKPTELTEPPSEAPASQDLSVLSVLSEADTPENPAGDTTDLADAVDAAEERAAILEFDAGLSRDDAERRALALHGSVILNAIRSGSRRHGPVATDTRLGATVTYQLLDRLIAEGRVVQARDGTLSVVESER